MRPLRWPTNPLYIFYKNGKGVAFETPKSDEKVKVNTQLCKKTGYLREESKLLALTSLIRKISIPKLTLLYFI